MWWVAVMGVIGLESWAPPAWHAEAVCAQVDPEIFFPEKGGSNREAKRICMSCPVRVACEREAAERDEPFGIWGGTSERERRRLKARQRRAAA